ncbi:lipid-A-disaccharide synthase N-terminal domain-containing protein [Alphaproteobacteria bacterium]|nr:lipid-A-disaccharide synthase N-terminal domain-containing protein [Alphaproteobacteria bacterium]
MISQYSNIELVFLVIGFSGQGLFASRFIIQWIYSEKKGQSVIPLAFWYLSIFGGLGLLTYAIFRKDPVIITGQLFGIFIYLRNIFLIYKNNNINKKIRTNV